MFFIFLFSATPPSNLLSRYIQIFFAWVVFCLEKFKISYIFCYSFLEMVGDLQQISNKYCRDITLVASLCLELLLRNIAVLHPYIVNIYMGGQLTRQMFTTSRSHSFTYLQITLVFTR